MGTRGSSSVRMIKIKIHAGHEFGEGGADLAIGFEAEDALDAVPYDIALFLGEIAARIEFCDSRGFKASTGIFVLFEDKGSAAEAGKRIENAGVVHGIVIEFLGFQRFEDLGDSE